MDKGDNTDATPTLLLRIAKASCIRQELSGSKGNTSSTTAPNTWPNKKIINKLRHTLLKCCLMALNNICFIFSVLIYVNDWFICCNILIFLCNVVLNINRNVMYLLKYPLSSGTKTLYNHHNSDTVTLLSIIKVAF